MNLLNLADGISREFIHTPDMHSRCAIVLQGRTFHSGVHRSQQGTFAQQNLASR
jgi:hypothetical protein